MRTEQDHFPARKIRIAAKTKRSVYIHTFAVAGYCGARHHTACTQRTTAANTQQELHSTCFSKSIF